MNKPPSDGWEERVQEVARTMPYPPTPDVVASLRHRQHRTMPSPMVRRLGWAVLGLLLLLGAALSVPGVRAALAEFFQLGAIRIQLLPETPIVRGSPVGATPRPSRTPRPLTAFAGALTLDEAERRSQVPIRLPTYPPDMGKPDVAFIDQFEGGSVLLLWLEQDNPSAIEMSLHLLGESFWGEKLVHQQQFRETSVNGQWAAWVEGSHVLRRLDPRGDAARFEVVEGNVLIWVEETTTYRLESRLPMEEAVRLAESLQ